MDAFEKLSTSLLKKKGKVETLDQHIQTFDDPELYCLLGEQQLQKGHADKATQRATSKIWPSPSIRSESNCGTA